MGQPTSSKPAPSSAARAPTAPVRPPIPWSYASLSEAEEEDGESRIYLGVHWDFDKTEGIAQGRKVADWVYGHAFLPE